MGCYRRAYKILKCRYYLAGSFHHDLSQFFSRYFWRYTPFATKSYNRLGWKTSHTRKSIFLKHCLLVREFFLFSIKTMTRFSSTNFILVQAIFKLLFLKTARELINNYVTVSVTSSSLCVTEAPYCKIFFWLIILCWY